MPRTAERPVAESKIATVTNRPRLDTNGVPIVPVDPIVDDADGSAEIESALREATEASEAVSNTDAIADRSTEDETRARVPLTAEMASLALSARFSPNSRHYIRGGHQARCTYDRETGRYFVEIHRRTPQGHVRTWVEIPDTVYLFAAEDPKAKKKG